MKALCVTKNRALELHDIPSPSTPSPGYVNVKITAAAINHGDITFLKLPVAASMATGARIESVWGASAAGTITEIGANVPSSYLGCNVAIYRGLEATSDSLGLWCEIAQIPYGACLLLPDHVDAKDYSGSLVNVVTAYAFLETAVAEGHRGVVVTAGGSATGRAIAVLARKRGFPILIIVRSDRARGEILKSGIDEEHVLHSLHPNFMGDLERKTKEMGTTAVFDGVGGAFISQIIAALPVMSSIYFYGFLSGAEKVEFHPSILMFKDLTMKRFSNFETPTIKDEKKKAEMLKDLEGCIDDPLFRTSLGKDFKLSEVKAAMEYDGGAKKAVFIVNK